MPALESRTEQVWLAKQSAQGTPASAPATQLTGKLGRKVAGNLTPGRDDGHEDYTDGARFSSATDFVDTVSGSGNPTFQGQASVAGYLAFLMCGQETVTGSAAPWTHVATPATSGLWFTAWKSLGASGLQQKQKYSDCRMTSLRFEAAQNAKVLHVTPSFISLDPGEVYATDPTVADDASEPMLFTDAVGTFLIDGVSFPTTNNFAVTMNDGVAPYYGENVTAADVIFTRGSIDVTTTILVNAAGLGQYNTIVYGTASPTAGTKPIKTTYVGSWSVDMTHGAGAAAMEVKIELPAVKWEPDLAIGGTPAGGAVELALTGQTRTLTGQPQIRVTTKMANAAFT